MEITAEEMAAKRAAGKAARLRYEADHEARGLCRVCVRPRVEGMKVCAACRERDSARGKARSVRLRAEQVREMREAAAHPDGPECPRCGNGARGFVLHESFGETWFRCRGCWKPFTPKLPVLPPPEGCPYCGGTCTNRGRNDNGARRFRCTVCGRSNTRLWPAEAPAPGGPFPRKLSINLGPLASIRLNAFCQKYKLSTVQAVREIFRRAAAQPTHKWAVARRSSDLDWDDGVVIHSAKVEDNSRYDPTVRFPNLSSALMKERMKRGKKHCSVAVSQLVTVRLDDLAMIGLLKTMQGRSVSHLAAARALIEEAV